MAGTGCYVCNYNGKEYAGECLKSVLGQAKINESFQLYMVDNASTDGSAEYVEEKFGGQVVVLRNKENLGGAGGFNTALKDAIENNYDYCILLDNDITLGDNCIFNMIGYMDAHKDVGCVGAKIMMMDCPDYMQEFGVHLDFERYGLKHDYWYELDEGTEEIIDSDCVASCALIVRVSCLELTGLFPEENFLYWDDLEFTYRIKLAGYRVVSLASAVAYHKGKKKPGTNTAPGYYGMRNRIKFFAKYEKEERLHKLCKNILGEYFQFFFGSASKGFYMANSSRMFALDDFVHKNYGRAEQHKVFLMDEKEDRIKRTVVGHKTVYIELPEDGNIECMEAVGALCRRLDEIENVEKRIVIVAQNDFHREEAAIKLKRYYGKETEYIARNFVNGMVFKPCRHIKDVTEDIRPAVWFDKFLNCVENEKDYEDVKAYPRLCEFFISIHYEWLMQGILAERGR